MKDRSQLQYPCVFPLIAVVAAMGLSEMATAQLAVAGFTIGQEVASCPAPSLPVRNNDCDIGIACRFPKQSLPAFGVLVDRVGFGTDPSGKIESVLASGIDAVQAAAAATNEYGAPDAIDGRNSVTYWGWLRGDVRLVITHMARDPAASFAILDRYPIGPVGPRCPPTFRRGTQ